MSRACCTRTHHDGDDDEHEHHHHEHAHEPLPIDQREVTSILVLCNRSAGARVSRYVKINKGKDRIAQAVAPAREVGMLLNSIVGPIRIVLLVLTVLVVIVAGISILVSIYNSMTERSHDIAVMRALGASRKAVMAIILVESILLVARRRIDWHSVGTRHDWAGESVCCRADGHFAEPVRIRLAGVGADSGAGGAGFAGGLFAGAGGVSDGCGQGAGGESVERWPA